MRILHLIDAGGPQASSTTLALLNASLRAPGEHEQVLLLLGGRTLQRQGAEAGIEGAYHLGVPSGRAWLGWPAVTRAVQRLGPFDLFHCWSISTLSWAALRYRSTPRVATFTLGPSRRAVKWLRVLSQAGGAPTVCLPVSNTIRRELCAAGVNESNVHVLRPGLDFAMVDTDARAALRQRWGAGPDDVRVIALLCDPPTATEALGPLMAVSLAGDSIGAAVPSVKLLVHPDQAHRRHAQRIFSRVGDGRRLLMDSQIACPWRVLPGCDYALAAGPNAGGLSLLWAMAANVPIVAEARYATSEIVEDRHSALLAKPNQPTALGLRLRQLVDDPQLAWKLRDTARHEAFSFFSRQRYGQSLHSVYRQAAAGGQIEIEPMPVTGGLRFAGRA